MNESDSHILSKATHLLALSALTLASTLCLAELPSRQPSNSTLPGRKVAEVSHVTETNGSNYFTAPVSKSEESKALISTNFVDLSKGAANLDAQFFSTEYIAPELYVSSTSTEEKRKKLNDNKVSVSRTYMGIGATGYIWGTKANKNIFISGNLLFGQERDSVYVDNQNGFALRVGGQIRPFNKIALDGGVSLSNITGEMKTDAFLRLGILL